MINFLKYKNVGFVWFIFVVTALVGGFIYNKQTKGSGFNYSVDFTGGTQVLFRFSKGISASVVQDILKDKNFGSISTREFSNKEILVRVGETIADAKGLAGRLKSALEESLPENTVEVLKIDSVGSSVGAVLRLKSIKALIIALLLMLLYISIFFRFAFAVGAITALFHDVIIILAYCALFSVEISPNILSALLAVLGYSINDSIVIFAKIRENLKKMKGASLKEIVNTSLNQTFKRTILTSVSTALVVISLLVFGGEILRGLAIALLLGIVFGTYSSIYIASPIMMLFYKKDSKNI
jgi:preprotein translocase subunit SecF